MTANLQNQRNKVYNETTPIKQDSTRVNMSVTTPRDVPLKIFNIYLYNRAWKYLDHGQDEINEKKVI
jgi:hypothetical protein